MKRVAFASILALSLTVPAMAEEDEESGFSLMEEGARLFMRGILEEMEPAMRELEGLAEQAEPAVRDFFRQMGPQLGALMKQIDDLRLYEAPEVLPNGDIIIRRRKDAPPLPDAPEGDIEI